MFGFKIEIYLDYGAAALYWFLQSLVFTIVYTTILVIPYTRYKEYFPAGISVHFNFI